MEFGPTQAVGRDGHHLIGWMERVRPTTEELHKYIIFPYWRLDNVSAVYPRFSLYLRCFTIVKFISLSTLVHTGSCLLWSLFQGYLLRFRGTFSGCTLDRISLRNLLDGWKFDDRSAIPGRTTSSLLKRPDVLTLL